MKRLRAEAGFTLIELLIAVVVLGVIALPLGNFMLSYLTNFQTTQQRVSDSHDILISSSYFSQDVANLGVHAATAPYAFQQSVWTSPPATYCGQGTGTLVLLLMWDVSTPALSSGVYTAPPPAQAAAAYVSNAGTLQRVYCPAAGPAVTSTLVHNFGGATVTCNTTCTAATPPTRITLGVTITGGSTDKAAPTQPVTLDGQRRQT